MASANTSSSLLSRINEETIGRATDALLKWINSKMKNQKSQLLEHDELIYVVITLKKIPANGRIKPYKIPIPHPYHEIDGSEDICLIIDDGAKGISSDVAKRKIESEQIPVSKVLKLSKLKTDYKPFEAKRKLCGSYDLFFADRRVIPLLPKLLGKQFFKKKKIPIAINLTHKNWKEQLTQCCSSALFYLRSGTCSTVKVARVSQGRDKIISNVISAIEGSINIVPKKWQNIRSIYLRSLDSVALPIYQALPEIGLKIEGYQISENDEKESNIEMEQEFKEDKENKEEKKVQRNVPKKGRIREVRYMDCDIEGLIDKDVLEPVVEEGKDEENNIVERSLNVKKKKKKKKAKNNVEIDSEKSATNGDDEMKNSSKSVASLLRDDCVEVLKKKRKKKALKEDEEVVEKKLKLTKKNTKNNDYSVDLNRKKDCGKTVEDEIENLLDPVSLFNDSSDKKSKKKKASKQNGKNAENNLKLKTKKKIMKKNGEKEELHGETCETEGVNEETKNSSKHALGSLDDVSTGRAFEKKTRKKRRV